MMRSNAGARSSNATASGTLCAFSIVWPCRVRIFSTLAQTARSSSTTNIRFVLIRVFMLSSPGVIH